MKHETSHNQLQESIQSLYPEKLSDSELFEAESNLLGYINELLKMSKSDENIGSKNQLGKTK